MKRGQTLRDADHYVFQHQDGSWPPAPPDAQEVRWIGGLGYSYLDGFDPPKQGMEILEAWDDDRLESLWGLVLDRDSFIDHPSQRIQDDDPVMARMVQESDGCGCG